MAFRFPSSIFGFDHASMVTSLGDFAKACLPYCIIEWRSYWKPKFSIMSAPYVFITPSLYAVIKRSYNHLLIMYDPLLRGLFLKPRFGTATVRAKANFSPTGEKSPRYFSYADIYRKKVALARRSLENEHKIKLVLSNVNMLIENKKWSTQHSLKADG